MTTLSANAARWHARRTLRPKGKRKVAKKGGSAKRRRRSYNLSNLRNQSVCVCHNNCVCGPPMVLVNAFTQVKVCCKDVSTQAQPIAHNFAVQTESTRPDVRVFASQTDPEKTAKILVDASTEIVQHNKLFPKAGTWTKGDRTKAKCQGALVRLKRAVPNGFHWSNHMIIVALRMLFGLIVEFNWQWTQAVYTTAKILHLVPRNVFKFGNDYIADGNDNLVPNELQMKVRGRGSAKFISNHGKDKYSLLKEVSITYLSDYPFPCLLLPAK